MSWIDDGGVFHHGRRPGSVNKIPSVKPKDKFGKWTVIRRKGSDPRGEPIFECRCVCGTIRPLTSYNLRKGRSGSCGCDPVSGPAHAQWAGYGSISGHFWDHIRRGSTREKGRKYEVTFEITIEYAWNLFVAQDGKCKLTGVDLVMSHRRREHTASLDRIDSRKGYVAGNVQWVHKEVNMMKRTTPQDRFIELCKMVAAHNS